MMSTDYLARLRAINQGNTRQDGTAQTAKINLRGLCSSPPAHIQQPATQTPIVGDAVTVITSRWWRVHFADGGTLEVACNPPATRDDIQERYPDATEAEPFAPEARQPSTPMTAGEEAVIRAWLAMIEETDPATIAEVLRLCQADEDARAYFLNQGRIH